MINYKLIGKLLEHPAAFGRAVGFSLLRDDPHNDWIISMIARGPDVTLQAHRGSYKTTCVSVALAILLLIEPNKKIAFFRKTDADVKEIISQVKKILLHPFTQALVAQMYGSAFSVVKSNANEITTSLNIDPRGAAQLVGLGIKTSITGKHFDRIFTDDIVNIEDRLSKAERDKTKVMYQELQNIRNRDGRIYNTGTPWHEQDAFSIMPEPQRYDCYSTGLISDDELKKLRASMLGSLFAANYELRHVASEDVIFTDPQTGGDIAMVYQARHCHIDAAYGGADYTAFTACRKFDGHYWVYGRLWHKPVDAVEDEIIAARKLLNGGRIYCEENADKGYLARELRRKGERVATYWEDMNKYLKIVTYLKGVWSDVVFVDGTDEEYIRQVTDYSEDAEHDDAPDSLASVIRMLWAKRGEEERQTAPSLFL